MENIMELFSVSRVEPAVFKDDESNHWGSENDARQSNAEIAMVNVFKKAKIEMRSLTLVRSLTRGVPYEDLLVMRDMFKAYIEKVLPQFIAIAGSVGWVREEGKSVHYPISHPWGDTSDSRLQGATVTLRKFLLWMASDHVRMHGNSKQVLDRMAIEMKMPQKKLSRKSVYSIANVSDTIGQGVSEYGFYSRFENYLSNTNDNGDLLPGQAETFLQALNSAIAAYERPVKQSR